MVVMGEINATDVVSEIERISEIKPNVLNARGILIATFSSVIEANILTDFFKSHGLSFLLFDLDPKSSGVHITKKIIHQGLFGFLKDLTDVELKNRTQTLSREISATADTKSSSLRRTIRKDKKISESDIDNMGKEAKENLLNELIEKGFEQLTEDDKKILKKLEN